MKKGAIYIFICYALWGVLPIFWKTLAGVNSVYVLCQRIFWSMIFCFLIIFAKGEAPALKALFKDKRQLFMLFLSGIMITINWGVYIYAVNSDRILEGSLAYYINPIISIIVGFVFFKEKPGALKLISVVTAAAGVLFAVIIYGRLPVLSLLIAGSFAAYSAVKKNIKAAGELSTFTETLFMTLPALIVIFIMEGKGMGAAGALSGFQFLLLPAAGIITSVPLLLFASGIKQTSMSLSGIIMYVNPTLQFLIGVIIYNEEFKTSDIITFAAVWIALILFIVSDINLSKKEARPKKS